MKTFPPCLLYFKSDRYYYEEAAEKERKKKELEGLDLKVFVFEQNLCDGHTLTPIN